ncbi:adenosylcobinamide-GDP ribazoletransferase [Micromonospora endophytica]|uniref:Adenosylcobinamide-GDP ribazoletransferase n=1 Tax=Micromonospora endophytica TaxID=515350 RepID=A0A2W2CNM7_9ACTN|nr:adenosylcobinamide-GDP ribazoletransferase [Micromonospora endophytica]PZF94764.1 adenosylcobinamide-GDP ribazoletransferase [Micromonospora endophytica]RIW48591.1 adenosylcobinamide-GDP ribazoletransferase [Micromonospora endophytica]BCJ61054.1 adenosylcobinamide-GDP ribazoletransferase [Micromonospora endophytica]
MSAEPRLIAGARLALTTFTVAPVHAGRIDRATAGTAMALAPVVGALLGVPLAGVLLLLAPLTTPLVAAGVTVGVGALLTRGLHLDGLADTVDALGSYRRGPAALEIMKKPDVGPFGVVALVLVLLVQAAALAELAARSWPVVLAAVVTATAAGRLGVTFACRRGVPPARPDGLGALVASTVGPVALIAGTAAVALPAIATVPGRPWQGPLAVLAALAVAAGLLRHTVRRLGGITGDVLGATVEVVTTLVYLGLLLSG